MLMNGSILSLVIQHLISQDRVQQLLERIILLVQQQLTSRQQQPWDRQVRQVQQEQLRQVLRRQALGLSGVTVSYKKVSVGNRYPTDAYAVCVPADSGCKVVAVEFTIKNTGSAVYNATTKSANVTMKLSAGSGTYTQYKSMLKNDICNLDKVTINAGEEYTAAAVFQVSTTDAGASGMKLEVLSGTQQVETINLQ